MNWRNELIDKIIVYNGININFSKIIESVDTGRIYYELEYLDFTSSKNIALNKTKNIDEIFER